ncbi:hypothetical protein LCGC14_1218570 [marine sediment metagenome]|uniref:Uncharacterized protein n=1 Tax=marine sediment metagenome TaxID=412755 RepID=A0A0F9LZA9_9ZZZZ
MNKTEWRSYYREARVQGRELAAEKFKKYPEAERVIVPIRIPRDFSKNINAYDFMFNRYLDFVVERKGT